MNDEEQYQAGIVPLTIGVAGHRDLVDAEVPAIRERVRALLTELGRRFPDRPVTVLSALAEGGDRLVAEVALELGCRLTVVLPMPIDLYRNDFERSDSVARFEQLRSRADEVLELPIVNGSSHEQLEAPEFRNRQYAQLGVFLCGHCHVLLALWDGKPSLEVGGTAQVVRFHHDDVMDGYAAAHDANQQILTDDETDLVYHVVVSRHRADGAPRSDLKALDAFWFTTDDIAPRTAELPEKHAAIFERTSDFNRDVREHASRIVAETAPLHDEPASTQLPPSVRRIENLFRAADWLAIRYQRRFLVALKCTLACVFVMAIMFLFYSHVVASRLLMVAFAACLVIAYLVHTWASRGRWHDKYLEYRTLAEGLRVQFYWAAAGVTSSDITKYTHDNFLQKQDVDLGWIRNVMRVAGMACDVASNSDPTGLQFVLQQWIGWESTGGQLKYYRRKAKEHIARRQRADTLGKTVGLLVMALLVGTVITPSEELRKTLFVVLGILLITVSVREAYAFRVAEKEVVKQYEFMYRIFSNAKKRLAGATTDNERRRILRLLGEAALDEHAEWVLLHRERPLQNNQLLRMDVT